MATLTCAFCHDIEPEMTKGRDVSLNLKNKTSKIVGQVVAHSQCLKYSANLYQEEDGSWDEKRVAKELERIKKLSCDVCRRKGSSPHTGAGCGCAYSKCRRNFHYPCIPITSKCRNEETEDMYLAFCSTSCENIYFSLNPAIQPIGKRQVRITALEMLPPSGTRSKGKSPGVKRASAKGPGGGPPRKESRSESEGSPGSRYEDSNVDDDVHGPGEGTSNGASSAFNKGGNGVNIRRKVRRIIDVSSALYADDERERSATSVDDESMDAQSAGEEESDVTDNTDNGAFYDDASDDGAMFSAAASGIQPLEELVANPQQPAPLPQQPAPQPQQAAPQPAQPALPPAALIANPPSPSDEGFESPDEGATEPRAVCVKLSTRHYRVQHLAGFVFPPDVMNGDLQNAGVFFDPRQEAIDLYQVINELTGRNYTLAEFHRNVSFAAQTSGHASCGNVVLDQLLPILKRNQREMGENGDPDQLINLHVVHPRAQRDFFRHLVQECFAKLCEDMRDKLSRSASPDDVCALMLFPLFFDGRAIIQPLYNGIIMPLVMSHGFMVSCLIGSRREQCDERRMGAWREWKWPSCALVRISPKTDAGN